MPSFRVGGFDLVVGSVPAVNEIVADTGEPVRYLATGLEDGGGAVLGAQLALLADGWGVVAVESQDAVKDVAGFDGVVGVGDDEDQVVCRGRGSPTCTGLVPSSPG